MTTVNSELKGLNTMHGFMEALRTANLETLCQSLFHVGSPSTTLAQREIVIGSTCILISRVTYLTL